MKSTIGIEFKSPDNFIVILPPDYKTSPRTKEQIRRDRIDNIVFIALDVLMFLLKLLGVICYAIGTGLLISLL